VIFFVGFRFAGIFSGVFCYGTTLPAAGRGQEWDCGVAAGAKIGDGKIPPW